MAVEQAAFVTCNSFRLLEVFNRHFKLKKEKKHAKEKKKHGVDTERAGRMREIKKGGDRNRNKQEKKNKSKKLEKKEIRLLASSQIFAFPLNQSVLQPNPLSADKSMQIEGLIGLSCLLRT